MEAAQPVNLRGKPACRHRPLWRVLMVILAAVLCPSPAPSQGPPAPGINYGPFHRTGQHPGLGRPVSDAQMAEDLERMSRAGFRRIRTYGLDNGLNRLPALAARSHPHLRFFLGIYACGRNHDDRTDPRSTRSQLEEAVRLAQSLPNVAGIVVGNECLPGEPEACGQPVDLAQLIEDLSHVKKALAGRPVVVTTAMSMLAAVKNHPSQGRLLALHSDVVMVNVHPFFAPAPIETAVSGSFSGSLRLLRQLYPKPVVIGETGWPSAGQPNGPAVPSPENQRRFVADIHRYSAAENLPVFLFEMFDEPWKSELGGVGPHWGIFDRDGRAKFELPWR
jgi:glucan 1,3-beta-glucosidase